MPKALGCGVLAAQLARWVRRCFWGKARTCGGGSRIGNWLTLQSCHASGKNWLNRRTHVATDCMHLRICRLCFPVADGRGQRMGSLGRACDAGGCHVFWPGSAQLWKHHLPTWTFPVCLCTLRRASESFQRSSARWPRTFSRRGF